jgi:hypothetical protein
MTLSSEPAELAAGGVGSGLASGATLGYGRREGAGAIRGEALEEASRRAGRLHRRGIVGLGLVTGGLMLWAGRLILEVHSGGRWPAGTAIVEYRAGDRLVRAAIRDVAFDSDSFDALTRPGALPRVRYDRGSPDNAILAAQHELVQPALWTLGVLAWIALVAAMVGFQLRRVWRLRRLATSPGPGRRMRVVGADDDPEDSSLVLAPLEQDGDPQPLGVPLVTGQHLAALRPALQVEVIGEPSDHGLVVVRLDSGLVLWPRGRCTAKV